MVKFIEMTFPELDIQLNDAKVIFLLWQKEFDRDVVAPDVPP